MTPANSDTEPTAMQPQTGAKSTLSPDKRDLVIERVLNAPRELVFKVWTDPKHVAQWWGPRWFTNPVCELDVRPGGAIRIHMADPAGNIYPMTGTYVEIVVPERLVLFTKALNEDGSTMLEGTSTVTFEDLGGKTKLTVHDVITEASPGSEGALAGMEEGWNQSLDKMTEYLATQEVS